MPDTEVRQPPPSRRSWETEADNQRTADRFRQTPYLSPKQLYPARLGRWPRRRARANPHNPLPSRGSALGGPPRRTRRQWRARSSPGGMSPRRRYRRPVPSRRAGTEMQQCNPQCGCSWGRCLSPCRQPEATGYVRSDRRIAVWRRVGWPGSSVRRRQHARMVSVAAVWIAKCHAEAKIGGRLLAGQLATL